MERMLNKGTRRPDSLQWSFAIVSTNCRNFTVHILLRERSHKATPKLFLVQPIAPLVDLKLYQHIRIWNSIQQFSKKDSFSSFRTSSWELWSGKKIEILDLSKDNVDCKPFILNEQSLLQPFSYCCDNANFKVCLLKVDCSNLLQGK